MEGGVLMPLTLAKTGEMQTIRKISGRDDTKRFLESLGFVIGGQVTVVSEINGNMIVNVKESRVAISKSMAARIMVYGSDNMEGTKTLKQAKIGEKVTVVKLTGEGAVKRRIMDMGITKGTEIFVRKVAPLGDPVEVTVRGYELSLRKADAEMIAVR